MRTVKKIALMAVGDAGWQGGIQYILNIVNALNAVSGKNELEVYLFRNSNQFFPDVQKYTNIKLVVQNIEEVLEPWSLSNRVKWFLMRRFGKSVYPRFENYLLNNHFDYVFPAMLSNRNGALNAGAWIADFQYHHFPDGASAEVTAAAKRTIGQIARDANKVILSSRYCEKDCLELFPVSKGKTHVMSFSVALDETLQLNNDLDDVREKYKLPRRYLMVANLFAPTKNHKTLFEALGLLRKQGVAVDLVCTGNIVDYRNHAYANTILEMLTENKIRSQVHLLGLIPRPDQLAMYRMAAGLVQPSINEGWSTSVEEAKALGKKLLMSDIEVHQEQYPNNPYMFKALDPADMAEKIRLLWEENPAVTCPQLAEEKKALQDYQQQVQAFGRKFLEIASG